jgi:hypothetical protein
MFYNFVKKNSKFLKIFFLKILGIKSQKDREFIKNKIKQLRHEQHHQMGFS